MLTCSDRRRGLLPSKSGNTSRLLTTRRAGPPLYFNGNPVIQTNVGSFSPKTTANLYLGYQIPLEPFPGASAGAMDEVGLFARALSAAEIRAIVLSRGTGLCKEPPTIVSQPANVRVNEGGDATFAVVASGNPILKYQWRRSTTNLVGATGTSLVLTNVQLVQAGNYSVRVTNAFGVIVSSNAVLQVNRPPVADATATRPMFIAPLHCDATVVLDGSRSSDPDGDPLQCLWFKTGAANAFATGLVAVVTLPAGTNAITLLVDDGLATNAQTITVEVIPTAQAVERFIALVGSQAERPQPLLATLAAASDALARGNVTATVNQLQAFENKVNAQVAPSAPALAEQFLQAAQEFMDLLTRDCSPTQARGAIDHLRRDADGKMRLQIAVAGGSLRIIEASTNLVDWEKIAVATECGPGEWEFDDPNAARQPTRFYRVVIP